MANFAEYESGFVNLDHIVFVYTRHGPGDTSNLIAEMDNKADPRDEDVVLWRCSTEAEAWTRFSQMRG